MAMHDQTNAGGNDNLDEKLFTELIEYASVQPSQFSLFTRRIPRIPQKLGETGYYDKYFVPKAVSIGPYHHGQLKLESVQRLKPFFTKELLSKHNVSVRSLYKKLGEPNMVKELKEFYEEPDTRLLSDHDFTTIMALDGCFILYYILFIYREKPENCRELRHHEIVLVHEDLFLVENQIPFKVLTVIRELIKLDRHDKFESFFADDILALERDLIPSDEYDHLFHLVYCNLTPTREVIKKRNPVLRKGTHRHIKTVETSSRRTFHSVNDLINRGIHIRRSSSMQLDNVEFVERCWWFSADLKLPPITVDRLLNLLAYELCSRDEHDAWVISYVCLLNSLIHQREDVRALRDAGVLDNPQLGNESDKEVADIFTEIGMYLVPNNSAYSKVKKQVQSDYDEWNSTYLTELVHDYLKSPWSLLALLVGVIVLFLSGVQTYFTVWSPKSECDDLCKFLKMNHHL
ncbi:hypothetical protein L2E82_01521 [Cichorium intybus]|uniref:Uncharacterized protein n=1 Tax=Cichorium intybus TaxID=13427 RepID=A0ACB9GZI7_CICIN|nr:hypothetical protein L2E82_01521 [Cichorium intybus]